MFDRSKDGNPDLFSRRQLIQGLGSAFLGMLVINVEQLTATRLREATVYELSVPQHPPLASVGGCVLLTSSAELALNPDQRAWGDAGLRRESRGSECQRGWYPIAVVRTAERGSNAFTAVSTLCPHEAEYQVRYDVERRMFTCCHKWSAFAADGTWLVPGSPGTDDRAPVDARMQRGLRRFMSEFDDVDTVRIFLPSKP